MPREISRRRFLEGGGMAVGAMVLGASGASLLAACGDGSSGRASSSVPRPHNGRMPTIVGT